MRRETVIAVLWWVHGEGATSASFWLSMTRIFAKTSSKSGRRTSVARGDRPHSSDGRGRRGLLCLCCSVAFFLFLLVFVSGSRIEKQILRPL